MSARRPPAESAGAPQRSISRKLNGLVIVAVVVATTLVTLFALWSAARDFLVVRRANLEATASIFATAASEPTARASRSGALEALKAIARIRGLTYAGLEDSRGQLLAEIGQAVHLDRDVVLGAGGDAGSIFSLLTTQSIAVVAPVIHGGRTVGRLLLVGTAEELAAQLVWQLSLALFASAIAVVLGWLAAARLQRSITRPIAALTTATRHVAESYDFRQTIVVESDDETGQLVADFNAMMREIRDRDARLAAHRASLEQEVADRTRDLRAAKDAADAANAAKSDFLATMSHEIRTPLNGLIVMAELLSKSQLAPAERRYADVVASSGQSLLAIIDDILDLAKVEAGRLNLESTDVDIAAVIDKTALLFSERAARKGVSLVVCVDDDVPAVLQSDPVRLGQVVGNLVNNALKFTDRGSVSIAVTRIGEARDALSIEVRDTGIGIARENLPRVFEAFTQADQTTTRRFGGTGLGLAIVRRIVEAMQGHVEIESEPGIGSTFRVILPIDPDLPRRRRSSAQIAAPVYRLAVADAAIAAALSQRLRAAGFRAADTDAQTQEPLDLCVLDRQALEAGVAPAAHVVLLDALAGEAMAAAHRVHQTLRMPLLTADLDALIDAVAAGLPLRDEPAAAARPAGSELRFVDCRILVVDDGEVNREVAGEALRRLGCIVETAANGPEAIAVTARRRFDAILMDVSMPGMDGYEATRRIHAQEIRAKQPRTTVFALTAHVLGRAADEWRAAGMDGIVTKPFTLERLATTLATALPSRATFVPVEAAPGPPTEPQPGPVPPAESNATTRDGEALIDPETLAAWHRHVVEGRMAFIERLAALYERHAPQALARMAEAAARGDSEAVRETAHALKSMSLNMGAKPLSALLDAIESAAGRGELPVSAESQALDALLCATFQAIAAAVSGLTVGATAAEAVDSQPPVAKANP
jgi:signal transduction histidine kinase/DNA-binding response OmpR family regulator